MMAKTKWIFGGQSSSQPPQDTKPPTEPVVHSADTKKFGYENFGNTCYANSVLQALYFCAPFRELVIQTADPSVPSGSVPSIQDVPSRPPPIQPLAPRRKPERKTSSAGSPLEIPSPVVLPPHPIPTSPPTLFSALRSLFLHISTHPSDKGTVSPKAFIDKLKEGKEDFRSTMHQDAHEFLNHLLNMIVEEMENEKRSAQNNAPGDDLSNSIAILPSKPPPPIITTASSNSGTSPQDATLVHRLFEGALTSETRCLTCETVSSRDEAFLDLSIDIEQNSSVTACLRSFSASEMLCQRNKFFCDACCDLQEAEKRMKIRKLPNVLALHLKRFKFQEDVQKYIKLAYRVAFPFELRLFNTVDELENADRLYNLFAIVVHIGGGPHHGHYISIVKSAGAWLVFDDDNVYPIPESDIPKYYGDSNSGSAYVLYYQAADIDLDSLGVRSSKPDPLLPPEHSSQPVVIQPRTPSQHGPATPSFPPGLTAEPDPGSPGDNITTLPPPLAIIPTFSAPPHFKSITSRLEHDLPPPPPNVLPAAPPRIVNPSSNQVTDLAPLRRPNTATPPPNDRSDKSTHSSSTRSPRHSASSPTLAVPPDPLPIPPIPPSHPPITQPPVAPPPVNDKGKDKDREKSRKDPKAWFKRRSFRIGEKSKGEKEKAHDESTSSKDEKSQPSNWFKGASQPGRRPDINRIAEDESSSTKLEPPQALSVASSNASSGITHQDGFSSSGPSVVLSSPPTSPSPPILPKSLSSNPPELNEQVDSPPPRKSSLIPTPRSRRSVDHRSNGVGSISSHPGPRPATFDGTIPATNGFRPLPPVPKLNGTSPYVVNDPGVLVPEPEGIFDSGADGHREPDSGKSSNTSQLELHHPPSMSASTSSLHVPHTLAPSRLNGSLSGNAIAANTSVGGAASPPKKPTRKLSFSPANFGLGRKDKDKEGRKISPGSFMQRFDPRV